MKAVFDTNILIDYLNGIVEAAGEFALYEKPLVSVITEIEVLVGAIDPEEEKLIRGFLDSFEVIPVSREVANQAVHLRRSRRIRLPGAIVYATAKVSGCILVTRNTKDFLAEWPDIRIPYQV